MEKLISIIVPVYNSEKYLEKCISSILNQTYKNIEIIIVDDGSKDKSVEICDNFSKNNKNIKVFHKKNEGVSIARNYGISKAKGDYILFIDSDDTIAKEMIYSLYNNLVDNDADISMCNIIRIDENGEYVDEFNKKELDKNPTITVMNKEEFIANILDYKCYFTYATNKLIKKSIMKNTKFRENIYYNEDGIFFIDLSKNIKKAVYIGPVSYYYYLQNSTSANAQKFNRKYATIIDSFKIMEDYFNIFNFRNKSYFSYRYINYAIECYHYSIKYENLNKVDKKEMKRIINKYFKYAIKSDSTPINKKINLILKVCFPKIMLSIKYLNYKKTK